MIRTASSPSPDLRLVRAAGLVEFPVHHMRGGTSTGLVLWERLVPDDPALREELIRHLMGVPLEGHLPGNRQITGLGRGIATSNKVFLAEMEEADGAPRIVSTLAQLAGETAAIDWSVNCGNMSSALQLWALDAGFFDPAKAGPSDIEIRNTNTGVLTTSRMVREEDGRFAVAEIPGVAGAFPGVDLFLRDPVGAKTGRLLPTGSAIEEIDGHAVSCVDVAVPMVIADAAGFGKTAREPVAELAADAAFMEAFRAVWIEAGLRMGLQRHDGSSMTRDEIARSETVPKACIVGPPSGDGNITVRYFTPQTGHPSMAVSGGCCLAAAAMVPGSVANRVAVGVTAARPEFSEHAIGIENPAGALEATVVAREEAGSLVVTSAAYRRSTQILVRGRVPLYRASPALVEALAASF
ncbi:PrpF domain-containing protein [Amorphus coralli]|uniref:PrpF domain-containing protein n=1 Tax=Amorphus coralli TaxID=340680 RepID=UPI0004121D40|nr:PrpF domain-containing protein [Amorphus coralli]